MWRNPYFQFALFTVALAVFYALAWTALLNIRDNYRRYYQKADLQWTGPESRLRRSRLRPLWVLLAALISAAIVVFGIIR